MRTGASARTLKPRDALNSPILLQWLRRTEARPAEPGNRESDVRQRVTDAGPGTHSRGPGSGPACSPSGARIGAEQTVARRATIVSCVPGPVPADAPGTTERSEPW